MKVRISLTEKEADALDRVLRQAAYPSWTAPEKAAYERAVEKLAVARRKAQAT